ncbi:MAG TPA: hypothetical protein VFE78_28235 [Gemmataceae bacterium]|nr:hypothetical protein [Gemmataceae bacterium]
MRGVYGYLGGAAAVALGLLTATAGRAQEKLPAPAKPAARETAPSGVYRMVIRNGATETVHYVTGSGVSPGDSAMLRDLEGAENEAMYARNLQRLKMQYVASERLLEPERRFIQKALYGQSISYGTSNGFDSSLGGYGGPGFRFAGGYPYYGGGYGGFGYGGSVFGSSSSSVNRSLANGMGDEGVLKNMLSQTIAQEATPNYTAAAMRNYNAAVARAGESNSLRVALGLPERKAGGPNPYRYAAAESTAPVVLTLKNGQQVEGSKMAMEGDFYVIETPTRKVRVLKSEVTRIDEAKSGVKPASE